MVEARWERPLTESDLPDPDRGPDRAGPSGQIRPVRQARQTTRGTSVIN